MSYATFNGWSIIPMPSSPAPREITLGMNDTVAITRSPFTQQSQVQQQPMGDYWDGNISLPLQTRSNAQPWLAFFASLRGVANVFQVGDPLGASPQGVSGNQILNAGFEIDGADSGTNADNWSLLTTSSAVAPIYGTGYSHTGGACQLMRWSPGTALTGTGPNQIASTPFLVSAGQSITFGGWRSLLSQVALTSGVTLLQRIALRFLSSSGTTVSESDLDYSITGDGSTAFSQAWTYVSATVSVPSGATKAILVLCAYNITSGGGGTLASGGLAADMYFDDVFAQFDSPVISGAQNAGATIISTRGWRPNGNGLLVVGDYLQIGYRLHFVAGATPVASDSGGNATFEIWPSLRESVADGAAIALNNTTGLFRLAENKRAWTVDYGKLYPLAFKIIEAR